MKLYPIKNYVSFSGLVIDRLEKVYQRSGSRKNWSVSHNISVQYVTCQCLPHELFRMKLSLESCIQLDFCASNQMTRRCVDSSLYLHYRFPFIFPMFFCNLLCQILIHLPLKLLQFPSKYPLVSNDLVI